MENSIIQSRWSYEDIKTLKPNWSKKKCEDWLYEHRSKMEDYLCSEGWNYIENNIEED